MDAAARNVDAVSGMTITAAHIAEGYENPDWLGYGYLGARQSMSATVRATADRVVVRMANERGWTPEVFFEWMNSKCGRWFGDATHGPSRWTQRDMVAATERLFDGIEDWMPEDVLATLG